MLLRTENAWFDIGFINIAVVVVAFLMLGPLHVIKPDNNLSSSATSDGFLSHSALSQKILLVENFPLL